MRKLCDKYVLLFINKSLIYLLDNKCYNNCGETNE